MSRQAKILFLTHFYPLFLAGHLYFGDWCRMCQVVFNVVPIVVFGSLFYIWSESVQKLSKFEQFCIRYLIGNIIFISGYYELCIFVSEKSAPWVYDRNWQVAAFLLITLILYIYKHRERT